MPDRFYLYSMNYKLTILVALVLSSFALIQCGKDCAREECDLPPAPTFAFRIVNNSNTDLLVGPGKMYDTAQLKITARRISTGLTENIKRLYIITKNAAGTDDSTAVAGITVNTNYSVYYLSLNNIVTDSLLFGYTKRMSNCCDLSYYFLSRVNTTEISGGMALPLSNGYLFRK